MQIRGKSLKDNWIKSCIFLSRKTSRIRNRHLSIKRQDRLRKRERRKPESVGSSSKRACARINSTIKSVHSHIVSRNLALNLSPKNGLVTFRSENHQPKNR